MNYRPQTQLLSNSFLVHDYHRVAIFKNNTYLLDLICCCNIQEGYCWYSPIKKESHIFTQHLKGKIKRNNGEAQLSPPAGVLFFFCFFFLSSAFLFGFTVCVLCSKGPKVRLPLQLFSWGSVHHSWVTEGGRCDKAAPTQGWPPLGVNCPPGRTGAGGRAGWASGSFSWAPRARPGSRWSGRRGKGSERLSPGGGWWFLHLSGRTGSLATESWTTGARRPPALAPDEAGREGHVGKYFRDLHRLNCCLHMKVQSKWTNPSLLVFRGLSKTQTGGCFELPLLSGCQRSPGTTGPPRPMWGGPPQSRAEPGNIPEDNGTGKQVHVDRGQEGWPEATFQICLHLRSGSEYCWRLYFLIGALTYI